MNISIFTSNHNFYEIYTHLIFWAKGQTIEKVPETFFNINTFIKTF